MEMTYQGSAKLLGINPALYSEELARLGRECDKACRDMESWPDLSDQQWEATERYMAAYRAWDELANKLADGAL